MSTTEIVLVGIGFVFAMLILITGILYLLPAIAGAFSKASREKNANKNKEGSAEAQEVSRTLTECPDDESEEELIAVITAAIESYNSQKGYTGKFRVVSLKRAEAGRNGSRR